MSEHPTSLIAKITLLGALAAVYACEAGMDVAVQSGELGAVAAPTPGEGAFVSLTLIDGILTATWAPASDASTPPDELEYSISFLPKDFFIADGVAELVGTGVGITTFKFPPQYATRSGMVQITVRNANGGVGAYQEVPWLGKPVKPDDEDDEDPEEEEEEEEEPVLPMILTYAASPFTFTVGTPVGPETPVSIATDLSDCVASPPLPLGIILADDCILSGTPAVPFPTTTFAISASAPGYEGSGDLTLTVMPMLPDFEFPQPAYVWTRGVAITPVMAVHDGGTPDSCAVQPALPAGLDLSDTCEITGTPTVTTAAADYVLTATNASGSNAVGVTVNVTIQEPVPAISYAGAPFDLYRNVLLAPITVTNTGGSITNCSISPALPAGLSFNVTTCAVSGTPSVTSVNNTYTVTASNDTGPGVTTFDLRVYGPPVLIGHPNQTLPRNVPVDLDIRNPVYPTASCTVLPALPTGLSMDSSCRITGRPSVMTLAKPYTITATNPAGTTIGYVSLYVDTPPQATAPFQVFDVLYYMDAGEILGFERTDPFSVSFWVNQHNCTYGGVIGRFNANTGRGWDLEFDAGCRLTFTLANHTALNRLVVRESSASIGVQLKWRHYTVTYDGSSTGAGVKIYHEGDAVPTITVSDNLTATPVAAGRRLRIGSNRYGRKFTGGLAEVAVWNRLLDPSEARAVHEALFDLPQNAASGGAIDMTGNVFLLGYAAPNYVDQSGQNHTIAFGGGSLGGMAGYDDDSDGFTEAEGDCYDLYFDAKPAVGCQDDDGDGDLFWYDPDDLSFDGSAEPDIDFDNANDFDDDWPADPTVGANSGTDDDSDGANSHEDCDDNDPSVQSLSQCLLDRDGDGYRDASDCNDWNSSITNSCVDGDGDGYSPDDGDCDDGDPTSYPGAGSCILPSDPDHDFDGDGHTENGGDCDDEDAGVFPGNGC